MWIIGRSLRNYRLAATDPSATVDPVSIGTVIHGSISAQPPPRQPASGRARTLIGRAPTMPDDPTVHDEGPRGRLRARPPSRARGGRAAARPVGVIPEKGSQVRAWLAPSS